MPDLEMLIIDLMSARGYEREFEQDLNACGYDQKELRHIVEDTMTEIGQVAHAAYQSAVPIRTGQLRNAIKLESRNRVEKRIMLRAGPHTNSNTSEKWILDNVDHTGTGKPGLGPFLNDGISRYGTPFRRHRNALRRKIEFEIESTSKNDLTMNWADHAYRAVFDWMGY